MVGSDFYSNRERQLATGWCADAGMGVKGQKDRSRDGLCQVDGGVGYWVDGCERHRQVQKRIHRWSDRWWDLLYLILTFLEI